MVAVVVVVAVGVAVVVGVVVVVVVVVVVAVGVAVVVAVGVVVAVAVGVKIIRKKVKFMSRSNPVDIIPNPSTRWFEWNADEGHPKYYDKEAKETVQVKLPFEFVLLDRLSVIKGFHRDSESGITSNEVRDTRKETLLVRAFDLAEPIAEGFYSEIKDRVKAAGGTYAINLYVAYTGDSGEMLLGAFTLKGAARSAWIDFESQKDGDGKTVRSQLDTKGVKIASTLHGEKGTGKRKIEWESPVFELVDLPQDVNDEATALDRDILQPYLRNYFGRARHEQASNEPEDRTDHSPEYDQRRPASEDDTDIPF